MGGYLIEVIVGLHILRLALSCPLTNRSAKILQVTSPSWPIASRCWCLMPTAAGASLVSFYRIVLFADQSAHESLRENSSGDIVVLANCKSLSVFNAQLLPGITGKFLSDRSFRGPVFSRIVLFADQSAHESFREKSQVTLWYFSTARTLRCS